MDFIPSPYKSSRGGNPIKAIVIHTAVGTYEGTIAWFKNNDKLVSSHYVVSLDGKITQMVNDNEAAHHAGLTSNPTLFPWYKSGQNPNLVTLGIECADNAKPSEADRSVQLPMLAGLVADLCRAYSIPADRQHIVGHRELYDRKTCPGNIDLDKLVEMVNLVLSPPPTNTINEDQNRALAVLSDYKVSAGLGNLESAVRDLVGKVGDLKNANSSMESLKNELRDRESFIQGQKATISEYQSHQKELSGILGVADEYPVIKGEATKLVSVEDDLDNARRVIESKDKEITSLKASGEVMGEFRLFGLLFKVYKGVN